MKREIGSNKRVGQVETIHKIPAAVDVGTHCRSSTTQAHAQKVASGTQCKICVCARDWMHLDNCPGLSQDPKSN
jgi:hypothetical protein